MRLSEEKEVLLEAIPEYEKKARAAENRTLAAVADSESKDRIIAQLEQKIIDQRKEIEDCQNELRILPEITQDTKYLSCQVWTLRKLLSGKDEIIRKQLNQVAAITGNVEDVYGTQNDHIGKPHKSANERHKLNLNMTPVMQRGGVGNLMYQRPRTAAGVSPGSRPTSRRAQKQSLALKSPAVEWKEMTGNEVLEPVEGGKMTKKGGKYNLGLDLDAEPTPDYHDTDLQLSKYITKG